MLYTPPAWIPRVLGFPLIYDVLTVTSIILGPTLRGPTSLVVKRHPRIGRYSYNLKEIQ